VSVAVDSMDVCPKCESPRSSNDQFCHFCGTAFAAPTPPTPTAPAAPATGSATKPASRPDYIGILSFGFLLVILGIVFALNPNVGSEFYGWVESSAKSAVALRPPDTLIASAQIFFGLATLSGFATAGMRYASERTVMRPLADVLASLATLAFAILLGMFRQGEVSGPVALAIEAAVVGVLIVVYVGLVLSVNRRSRQTRTMAPQPADRRDS